MEEKKKKSLKNIKIASLAALAVAVLSFGGSWAYYTSTSEIANPLNTSHSGAALVEEFNPDSSFLPGETVVKKLKFANTGDMDLLLRVEVPPLEGWYDGGEPDINLDPSMVIKNWSETWLDAGKEAPEDGITWNDSEEWSQTFQETDAAGKTRYYRYYKKVLPVKGDGVSGETKEILESISLSTKVSNDRHEWDYSDKVYKLTFNAEAIPVEMDQDNQVTQSVWNVSVTENADGTLSWALETAGNGN